MEELIPMVASDDERHLLVVAAWRHDLGYAPRPETPDTPVGGARYLTVQAYPKRLCAHRPPLGRRLRSAGTRSAVRAGRVPREDNAVADAL